MNKDNINNDEITANTFLLAIFLGVFGIHSFYHKKILIGILQLISFGGFTIWTLIDIYLIVTEKYNVNNEPLIWGNKINNNPVLKIRLCAFIMDMFIVNIIISLLQNTLNIYEIYYNNTFINLFSNNGFNYLYYIIYSAISLASFHTTFGKRICKIYIKNLNGKKITMTQAFVRQISTIISFSLMLIGFFIIDFNKKKLSLHDYIAKTQLVYAR